MTRSPSIAIWMLALVAPAACASSGDGLTSATTSDQPVTLIEAPSSTTAVAEPPPTVQSTTAATSTTITAGSTTTTTVVPAASRTLALVDTIADQRLQPKSVVATPTGLLFAQNMMYRHNVMVLNEHGEIIRIIDDEIDPASFGLQGPVVRGSPVEAAVAPDARHVYVSNYKLYGAGYRSDADDNCDAGAWEDSLVFRINTETLAIDGAVTVGAVPKFMAVTPDGTRLLVANWCGFDVSVIDLASFTEVARIPVGRHPRGLAVSSDSTTAYVAVMGAGIIRTIDLASLEVNGEVVDAGPTPRHLVLSDDDRFLFVTNNYGDTVRKLDLAGRESPIIRSVPSRPRTMVASDDGSSLYVVSYDADTLTVLRATDLEILQQLPTGDRPIGVTFEERTRSIWVANYSGSLMRFAFTDLAD